MDVRLYTKHPKQPGSSLKNKSSYEMAVLEAEFSAKQALLMDYARMVEPLEYYRDMFPSGCFEPERSRGQENETRRPNGLLTVLDDPDFRGRSYNRLVFDDLADIQKYMDKNFVLIAPVGYSGRRRLSKYAYQIFGFCIDLDDVGVQQAKDLMYQMQNGILPTATYIVNSGTGLHVVYLFDTPTPAMPQYYESLNRLKADISSLVWNAYTSRSKDKQSQGIFQAFRMVGSPSKLGPDYRVTAFKFGPKTSIHQLNEWAEKENRCIFDDWEYVPLDEAAEEWPEWYQRRIIEQRPLGDYELSPEQIVRRRAWYDAWIDRLRRGAVEGNRYYCMAVLFNYAMKAEIPISEALDDAFALLPWLDSLTTSDTNHFTTSDIMDATRYYDRKYIKMGRKGILRMTRIDIGQTKRKGRSQKQHLQADYIVENGRRRINTCKVNRELALEEARENGLITGRPKGSGTKQAQIEAWQLAHPDGKKADCHRETGISRPTIDRWWKG